MTELETFTDLTQVDAAQGQVNERGERIYTVDPKFRRHIEAERARLMAGQSPSSAPADGVTTTGWMGSTAFGRVDGSPPAADPRMIGLCDLLSARVGPDGKRLADTDPSYRARVEASYAEAMGGKQWSWEAERLAASLVDEARNQAADSGLYPGAEKQRDFTYDRTDPTFQSAARVAKEQGLNDVQFGALLNWYAGVQAVAS